MLVVVVRLLWVGFDQLDCCESHSCNAGALASGVERYVATDPNVALRSGHNKVRECGELYTGFIQPLDPMITLPAPCPDLNS